MKSFKEWLTEASIDFSKLPQSEIDKIADMLRQGKMLSAKLTKKQMEQLKSRLPQDALDAMQGSLKSVANEQLSSLFNKKPDNKPKINAEKLKSQIDQHLNSIVGDINALVQMYSDPKKHKLDFVETFDKYNLDFKALTLIKYFINLGDQLDSSIGLHCLKHYQESGMLKKYPKDVVEQAVSWMRVYKYDPDVFFGDMDFTNPEAVAFFKKKGFKF